MVFLKEVYESSNESDLNSSSTDEKDDEEIDGTWQVHQLAWAQMTGYPYWPCYITYDPHEPNVYQKFKKNGKNVTKVVHVHFFNDNGQHSWMPSNKLLNFYGTEHFRQQEALFKEKKNSKLASAFKVNSKIFRKWQFALAEALDVLFELDFSPLEKFKYDSELNNNSVKDSGKERKRLHDTSLKTPELKKIRLQQQMPNFETYFEKNVMVLQSQNPELSIDDIREYSLKEWNLMTTDQKAIHKGVYKVKGK